jgi:hypothetical protein
MFVAGDYQLGQQSENTSWKALDETASTLKSSAYEPSPAAPGLQAVERKVYICQALGGLLMVMKLTLHIFYLQVPDDTATYC